jgi:7-cyano-7-deazaguanine synthase in queuosine biosynthesis
VVATERIIYCGGVTPANATDGPLLLNVWKDNGVANVWLGMENIRKGLLKNVPQRFEDLLEIATYVYAADQATVRGEKDVDTFGASWRRNFEFHVPVREADFWNAADVKRTLCETLGFLSDDYYSFNFYPALNAPSCEGYLDLQFSAGPGKEVEDVIMYSGGLDSVAGAVKEAVTERHQVMLVTHRPIEKHKKRRETLARLLAGRAGALAPEHLSVLINKEKRLGKEPTQRSRSFLFVSLGATVARMLGLQRVRFYENGVVGINLPVLEQVLGGRASRTTHPRTLAGFQNLLSLVAGGPFTVDNPFLWETKGDVVRRLLNENCGPLIGQSMSCAHTWETTNEFPHCGTCSQCLDRRFAVIAAGAAAFDPREQYRTDVFTGARPEEADKLMGAGFVERANKIASINDNDIAALLAKYPQVSDALPYLGRGKAAGAGMILDLYRKHANEVKTAAAEMIKIHAPDLVSHNLPPDCLLRSIYDSAGITPTPGKAAEASVVAPAPVVVDGVAAPAFVLRREAGVWTVVFGGKAGAFRHEKGALYVDYLLKNSEVCPIHGVQLFGLATGQGIIQEANLAGDGAGTMAKARQRAMELMDVLKDPNASDKKKVDAREELEAIAEAKKKMRKGPSSNSEKTVRAVRKAISRLHETLADARRQDGSPHPALTAFAEHIMEHVIRPSARYGGHGRGRVNTGIAGSFTYEPPDGVVWLD